MVLFIFTVVSDLYIYSIFDIKDCCSNINFEHFSGEIAYKRNNLVDYVVRDKVVFFEVRFIYICPS